MEQQDILKDTHDKLAALVGARDYDAARSFLIDRFARLPEDIRGRILVVLLADAIETEAVALDEALAIQQEGITALKALEEMRVALVPIHHLPNPTF